MKKLCYLSLGLNLFLLAALCLKSKKKSLPPAKEEKTPADETSLKETVQTKSALSVREGLRKIAVRCEEKLPPEDRGKISLLTDTETAAFVILQIDGLNISLCRDGKPQSLFYVDHLKAALSLACDGYAGTGRYIPVPKEVKLVLKNRKAINIYLEALELEQIPEHAEFCCLDVETGWNTGWKRFNWDVDEAFSRLKQKFRILNAKGELVKHKGQRTPLFLLLKGWEHLFAKV